MTARTLYATIVTLLSAQLIACGQPPQPPEPPPPGGELVQPGEPLVAPAAPGLVSWPGPIEAPGVEPAPTCADLSCDDGDPCTVDGCADGECRSEPRAGCTLPSPYSGRFRAGFLDRPGCYLTMEIDLGASPPITGHGRCAPAEWEIRGDIEWRSGFRPIIRGVLRDIHTGALTAWSGLLFDHYPVVYEPSNVASFARRPESGRCCAGETCEPTTRRECVDLGGGFVSENNGACCGLAGCEVMTRDACYATYGADVAEFDSDNGVCATPRGCYRRPFLDCTGDGLWGPGVGCDDPTFADAARSLGFDVEPYVPPFERCDYEEGRVTVTMLDGRDLTVRGDLVFTADERGVETEGDVTIEGLGDPIVVRDVRRLEVDCSATPSVRGEIDDVPDLGLLAGFTSSDVSPLLPGAIEWGVATGQEIADRLSPVIAAPTDPATTYLYFYSAQGFQVSMGGAVPNALDGQSAVLLVDPTDPAVVLQVSGTLTPRGTLGLGLSSSGDLRWSSALPVWDGTVPAPGAGPIDVSAHSSLVHSNAHLWVSGETTFYAGLLDFTITGDFMMSFARPGTMAETFAGEILDDSVSLSSLAGAAGLSALLGDLTLGGNVQRLAVGLLPGVGVSIGRGTAYMDSGGLVFAGEAGTADIESMLSDAGLDVTLGVGVRLHGRVSLEPVTAVILLEGSFTAGGVTRTGQIVAGYSSATGLYAEAHYD